MTGKARTLCGARCGTTNRKFYVNRIVISAHVRPNLDLPFLSQGLISREDRAKMTGNSSGCTLWVTGLSGSGKSTVACALEETLLKSGIAAYRLDGDNIRFGLNKDLGTLGWSEGSLEPDMLLKACYLRFYMLTLSLFACRVLR